MVLLGDIRSILCLARLLGCSSLVVAQDTVKVTKISIICSGIYSILYITTGIMMLYFYTVTISMPAKILTLSCVRVLLSYFCLFADISVTTLWASKIRSAISQMRNFDRATKYNDPFSRRKIRMLSRCTMLFSVIYWITVGYLSYSCEDRMPIVRGVTYGIVNASLSVQILSFVGISILLHERFRWLCKLATFPEEGRLMTVEQPIGQFRLQDIWWLHSCLVKATELINSTYAIQLLLWIACMSFNMLSRLYTLNENEELPLTGTIRELMLVLAFVGHLLLITAICHVTSYWANRVGEMIFSPLSPVLMKRYSLQENVEAIAYFQRRKVYFFGVFGFMRIDLPLLFSIASAITTYLVILHAGNNE